MCMCFRVVFHFLLLLFCCCCFGLQWKKKKGKKENSKGKTSKCPKCPIGSYSICDKETPLPSDESFQRFSEIKVAESGKTKYQAS